MPKIILDITPCLGKLFSSRSLREVKEKLFYILFYLKCYPTYDLAGLCFDVDRSQAFRWVEELLPMLRKVLAREGYQLKPRHSCREQG
jgi:hypothetical protein